MFGLMSRITFYRKAVLAIVLIHIGNDILGWFTLVHPRAVPGSAKLAFAAMARLSADLASAHRPANRQAG
jgi:hypothetical protein